MAFKPEQEVPPENIEMIGRPVQESSCVKTRPWPSSDKQSHNHPGAADTLGTNSKPVFAHGEGLAVCEMTEDAEGVEEGKMEKKAEEKVAEAKLGVLCSPEGMPRSCLSQEAEPQSPTMAEHKPRPDGSTAEGHIKVTDRKAGQKKVFRKRQKAKPKMQMAEAAGTEGGPQNTRAPFRLQDFMCSKISKYTVLFLLMLLESTVYSSETPKPGMCAVCLEKDCATGLRIIYRASSDTPVWVKANSRTGIQNCSMENLKADAPCKMANGSLVQLADIPLYFEGIDTYDVRCTFHSQISPCADLNLPPSSTPSPGMCAVCLEKDCTTGVRIIFSAGSDTPVWVKANSPTGIQSCSTENLKPDAPCKMANGNLVQLADNPLHFEGAKIFNSQILPCADLNLPPKPSPGMCAVCLEKDCTTGVREISLAGSITTVWVKGNSPTAIQNCSMENLKPDAPCKMANGSLAQLADNPLHFEGIDTHDVRRAFHSQILPCADLINSKPSPVTKAPIHNTSPPAATNNSVADNKDIIIGSVIGSIIISIVISFISIGFLIWKLRNRRRGLFRGHRKGNNRVPHHYAEHRHEFGGSIEMMTALGLQGYLDDSPV